MNIKSLIIATIVAFVTIWGTDILIHQVWLSSAYGETKHLWRPEVEMMARMPLMFLGQLLSAAAFCTIFAMFVAEKRSVSSTMKFALCVALFSAGGQIIMYAVQPVPGSLVIKWCVAYIVQLLVLGFIVHKVYKLPVK